MQLETTIFENPVPYPDALRLQEELVGKRQADLIPDTLLILEHPPVITLGIRAKKEHLLILPDELHRQGIDVYETPRGGDITYHAPGQIILYPIMKLAGPAADAHAFVQKLEEVAIQTAREFGVTAYRRKGKTGVWTNQGKIAAIGIRFKKWVSSHGMSFNVDINLNGFNNIVPCGLHGEKVASLESILTQRCPSVQEVRCVMVRQFKALMGPPSA